MHVMLRDAVVKNIKTNKEIFLMIGDIIWLVDKNDENNNIFGTFFINVQDEKFVLNNAQVAAAFHE